MSQPQNAILKLVRIVVGVIATLAILMGSVWVLQGVNILPGSFMTGDIQWAYRGAALAVVGAGLLFWMTRQPGVGRGVAAGFGGLMVLMGVIWILQGLNILPGSFMTGHIEWTYRGVVLAVIGAALILASRMGRKAESAPNGAAD
jgi:hypothetical protein